MTHNHCLYTLAFNDFGTTNITWEAVLRPTNTIQVRAHTKQKHNNFFFWHPLTLSLFYAIKVILCKKSPIYAHLVVLTVDSIHLITSGCHSAAVTHSIESKRRKIGNQQNIWKLSTPTVLDRA